MHPDNHVMDRHLLMQLAVFVLISCVLTYLVSILQLRRSYRNASPTAAAAPASTTSRLPPGSMGWPFLGQTLQILKRGRVQDLEPFIERGRSRYGKLFKANLFGRTTIVSSDPEVTKFVLQNEGRLFQADWPNFIQTLLGERFIIFLSGHEHRLSRGLFVSYIGAGMSKLPEVLHHIECTALETIRAWEDNSFVGLLDQTKSFNFAVSCKLFIRLRQSEVQELHALFRVYDKAFGALPIRFPGTPYSKGLQARAKLVQITSRLIHERTENPRHRQNDILDFLLSEGERLSTDDIQDLLLGAFFAGYVSISRAVAAIVKLLKDSPRSLEEILKEHDGIRESKGKSAALTIDDYLKMSFTQNVINEALRLINFSIGMFRVALEDVELKGHLIPKGYRVYVSQSSSHLDPELFPDPSTFDPFRWQNLKASSVSQFVPFGGGIRLCPGAELAKLQIAVFLHHFLTTWSWEALEPDEEIIHNPIMVTMTKGVPIRVKSRRDY